MFQLYEHDLNCLVHYWGLSYQAVVGCIHVLLFWIIIFINLIIAKLLSSRAGRITFSIIAFIHNVLMTIAALAFIWGYLWVQHMDYMQNHDEEEMMKSWLEEEMNQKANQ